MIFLFLYKFVDLDTVFIPDTNPNFGQTNAILWHFFPEANWAINRKSKGL
jgi:hypothetical protein